MASKGSQMVGPRGGIRVNERTTREWGWNARGKLVSRPVRCRREDWYLARARLVEGSQLERAAIPLIFLKDGEVLVQRCVRLVPPVADDPTGELVGWTQTPDTATHLQLMLPDAALTADIEQIVLHDVAERDPKCHPLANVPRWDTHRPAFPITRVILPASLRELASLVEDASVEILETPGSRRELTRAAQQAVCVLDPQWVKDLKLTLKDVERMAAAGWVIVDLETMARLAREAGVAGVKTLTHEAAHGFMSARVAYSDVPTRGLALQDVVPYTVVNDAGGFRVRVLEANASWRRYADDVGFATLLSSETPWTQKHGDVLSAMRPVAGGELITTDLPWLVAGRLGRVAAPRVAAHLLRMHLGERVADYVQYWNRWDDGNVVVRDISDLARRYAPLRPVRWASADPGLAHLGLTLAGNGGPVTRHVMIRTGRRDYVDSHDGLPPEPLMIFMKWLAREVREDSAWARQHLGQTRVTWQFDSRDGLKYAANYDAAQGLQEPPPEVVQVRLACGTPTTLAAAADEVFTLTDDDGLHGDGSFAFQEHLTQRLRAVLERAAHGAARIARDVG